MDFGLQGVNSFHLKVLYYCISISKNTCIKVSYFCLLLNLTQILYFSFSRDMVKSIHKIENIFSMYYEQQFIF
jgi:hypothetical protein